MRKLAVYLLTAVLFFSACSNHHSQQDVKKQKKDCSGTLEYKTANAEEFYNEIIHAKDFCFEYDMNIHDDSIIKRERTGYTSNFSFTARGWWEKGNPRHVAPHSTVDRNSPDSCSFSHRASVDDARVCGACNDLSKIADGIRALGSRSHVAGDNRSIPGRGLRPRSRGFRECDE